MEKLVSLDQHESVFRSPAAFVKVLRHRPELALELATARRPLPPPSSIIAAVMLAITTPLGVILHTGDFKVDPTPTDNRLFDLHTFAEYGKEKNVLALLQDSTNAERRGYTPSERAVRGRFDEIFARLVIDRAGEEQLRAAARAGGMVDLKSDGIAKAAAGSTSLDEVLRVTGSG